MSSKLHSILGVVLTLTWVSPTLALSAAERERARQLVSEGGELTENGELASARDRFLAALQLAPVPAIALYAGRALEGLGELTKAARLYRMAAEMPLDESLWDKDKRRTQTQLHAREEARIALEALIARNASLTIQLEAEVLADIVVAIDEQALDADDLAAKYLLAPGTHVVSATQGARHVSKTIELREREEKSVTIDLRQDDASDAKQPRVVDSPSSSQIEGPLVTITQPSTHPAVSASPRHSSSQMQRHVSWVALGVGAAGLGVGATAAFVAWAKRADLIDQGCSSDGVCPRDGQVTRASLDSHNTWRTISTIGFIVGGIGAAAGVTLWLTKPAPKQLASIGLHVGPQQLTVHAAF